METRIEGSVRTFLTHLSTEQANGWNVRQRKANTNGGLSTTALQGPEGSIPNEILAQFFESDIVPDCQSILYNYGPETVQHLLEAGLLDEECTSSRGILDNSRWSTRVDDVVVVPYEISNEYRSHERLQIDTSLQDLSAAARVVKFLPCTTETEYIRVIDGDECSSWIGFSPSHNPQSVTLSRSGCLSTGTIQHKFMHALGFYHEQSRSDRDTHVSVNFDNIENGKEYNFEKRTQSISLGSPYDYGSVMHYGAKTFSKNGLDTITVKKAGAQIGQRDSFSWTDNAQIQLLYQCRGGPRTAAEAREKPCNSDCKCWEWRYGCQGIDDFCQGRLICLDSDICGCTADSNCPDGFACLLGACILLGK